MPGPELVDGDEDGSNPGDEAPEDGSGGGSEPSVGKADLGIGDDDGLVAGFDGVEDEQGSEESSGSSGGGGGGGSGGGESIADSIEDGLAEVACIGLEGQDRKRVRSEMRAVAGQFRIGYFGQRTVEKYLEKDLDDIPPEYGLLATVIAFGAVALYKRPDGQERVRRAYTTIRDRFSDDEDEGAASPNVTTETEEEPREESRPEPEEQEAETDEEEPDDE